MQVAVEFFGVPRRLVGVAEAALDVADGADLREVLGSMRARFPALSPSVIAPDVPEVQPPYMLSIDGRCTPSDLGRRLLAGERVLILSSLVGG